MSGMSLAEENAEVLAEIAAGGADLSAPRTIDFAHLFYSEAEASGFKHAAEEAGYTVQIEAGPASERGAERGLWDVIASSQMVPTVERITQCEEQLGALAEAFGGHSDGWGFEST
jgi:regulator of RNase E activity RraB